MIVKLAAHRRDGKSSFERLSGYITEGIEQSGDRADRTNWDDLTQYLTTQSVLDALGDAVDKTIGVEIGNLSSLASAAASMASVAASTTHKRTDPALHLILSWPENETPDPKSIFRAARHIIGSMGLLEHQYIVAIHDNTENRHAHIEINRIHPRTFRPARLEWLLKTVHKAAREAEIAHGWFHDNGIYEVIEVNGEKLIVEARERNRLERAASFGANRSETWSGEASLETWVKGSPARALREALNQPDATTWQHVHDTLARFSLALRDSGGRGMRVHDISEPSGPQDAEGKSISASSAFRFMKRAVLEGRFGPFQTASTAEISSPSAAVGYKRDPLKRIERKAERRDTRDALHARFKAIESTAREVFKAQDAALRAEFAGSDEARRTAHKALYSAARHAIARDPDLDGEQKQQAYMIAKISHAWLGAQLREQLIAERAQRRASLPEVPVWRTWTEAQAAAGDEAAISALRGMVYQDGREGKKSLDASEEASSEAGVIRPARRATTDPYARLFANLTHTVSKHGTVSYSLDPGKTAFLDVGPKLRFAGPLVSDDELQAALLYAAEKWGGTVRLSGGDAVFRERAARVAADLGISILNSELQAIQRQHIAARRAPASMPHHDLIPADQHSALILRKYRSLSTHREAYTHDFKNPFATREASPTGFGYAHPAAVRANAHAIAGNSAPETLDSLRTLSSEPLAGLAGQGAMLLPQHAHHDLVDDSTDPSHALRRADRSAGAAGWLSNSQAAAPYGVHVGTLVGRDQQYLYQQTATGLVRHDLTPALATVATDPDKSIKVEYRSGRPAISQGRSR